MRVAAVQTDPHLGESSRNLAGLLASIRNTSADLIVFPECALQGYGFGSLDDGMAVAETVPGPSTLSLAAACREQGKHVVVGMLERAGDRIFNTAAVIGPSGVAGVYRKVHLPWLGIDRFVTPGDLGFPVFPLPIGRIGILICYDLSFPEASRALKLGGAELLCVPTNWPMAAEVSCLHAPPVRAQENHFHVVTCDRVGEESGFRFRGGSQIADCDGRTLARAGDGPETIAADLDLAAAGRNRVVIVSGLYELDRIGHRRPELYGALTRPVSSE